MDGFTYNEFGAFVDVRLDGRRLSIKELSKIAEQMRVELLSYGVVIQFKTDDKGDAFAKINQAKEDAEAALNDWINSYE